MENNKKHKLVQINVSRETRAAIKLLAARHQLTMQEYVEKLIKIQK
jgi:predicted DNA binding CopG/RHH family protein